MESEKRPFATEQFRNAGDGSGQQDAALYGRPEARRHLSNGLLDFPSPRPSPAGRGGIALRFTTNYAIGVGERTPSPLEPV